jgi:hypothetical protein
MAGPGIEQARATVGEAVGTAADKAEIQTYFQGKTWIPWVSAEGVTSRTVTRALGRNALVRQFRVRVAATRADATTLANSGQVRLQSSDPHDKVVVVDFGMLRTVSGVGRVPRAPDITIASLRAFKGDGFDTAILYSESLVGVAVAGDTFETRTERVRLGLTTEADLAAIADNVWLQFPDLPSDLDIRINGGAPAWAAPGVAQPNTHGWDADTRQVADLTAALGALTGKADDPTPLDASIVLSSRIPGLLTLAEEAVDIAYLARIAFDGAAETTLVFDQEGRRDVVLRLPAWVKAVQEVRLTLTATVPAERILEPIGPPLALQSGGGGAAYDLLLDVDHSGAARLDPAAPFGELVAVRLPLRAGADGAEVRAVVYEGAPDSPTRPLDGGTSKPVDLAPAAADAGDVWTSFALARPPKLDPGRTYWVVVVVGRGRAAWSPGRFPTAGEAIPIRRGGSGGAWHPLPDVVLDGATVGARVRAVGTPRAATPVAPLSIGVAGHEAPPTDVLPTPKGVSAVWLAPGAVSGTQHPSIAPGGSADAPTITLQLTARMTGTVKVSAVDVVATK